MTTVYVVTGFYFCSGIIAVILALKSFGKKDVPSAYWFGLLMCSAAAYSMVLGMESSSQEDRIFFFWLNVEYVFSTAIPVFWIIFTGLYTELYKPRKSILLLFLVPAATFVLVLTRDSHSLHYVSYWLEHTDRLPVFKSEKGPWYWVNAGYAWTLLMAGIVLLFIRTTQSTGKMKINNSILVAGCGFMFVINLAYYSGITPHGLEVSPFAFTVAGGFFYFALSRLSFLDFIPIARERVFSAMMDGAVILDSKGRVLDFNNASVQVFPFAQGMPLSDAGPEIASIAELIRVSGQKKIKIPGTGYHFLASGFPIGDAKMRPLGGVIMFRDITESEQTMEHLEVLANTDPLTGFLNRRSFFELFGNETVKSRKTGLPFTVIMADLDHFKAINDTYGHAAGDFVIKSAADLARKSSRSDDALCRWGGEEFAARIPRADACTATSVAERFRGGMEALELEWEGKTIRITVSAGIYVSEPEDRATPDECINRADAALYAAKKAGRNRVVIWDQSFEEPEEL